MKSRRDIEARNRVVEANMGLAITIANGFRRRVVGAAVDIEDLKQEGMIGLMRAAELYDPGRRTKFSGYAASWIKARIKDAIREGSPIVVPKWAHSKAVTWRRLAGQGLGEPEILGRLKLSVETAVHVRRAMEIEGFRERHHHTRETIPWRPDSTPT